eukprot:2632-Heterococcus_DN1.PRE.2
MLVNTKQTVGQCCTVVTATLWLTPYALSAVKTNYLSALRTLAIGNGCWTCSTIKCQRYVTMRVQRTPVTGTKPRQVLLWCLSIFSQPATPVSVSTLLTPGELQGGYHYEYRCESILFSEAAAHYLTSFAAAQPTAPSAGIKTAVLI